MSNMNQRTRNKLYPILVLHDGEKCNLCNNQPPQTQLVIDHIDGNNSNNDISNLRLLCRSCNYHQGRTQPLAQCVSNSNKSGASSNQLYIYINKSRKAERKFRKYVYDELDKINSKTTGRTLSAKDLIYSGAEKIHSSPVTTKRYLEKMCSSEGKLEYTDFKDSQVRFKPTISLFP